MNKIELLKKYVSIAKEKCVGEGVRFEAFRYYDRTDGSYFDICMSSIDKQGVKKYHKFLFRRDGDLFVCINVKFDICPDEFIYRS